MPHNSHYGNDRRKQNGKSSKAVIAIEKGIFGIRRPIHKNSVELFSIVKEKILDSQEIMGAGRLFVPETLGLTVVGFSRFSRKHRDRGPKTQSVVECIPSCASNVEIELGRIGIFGSKTNPKLGFHIASDKLENEREELSSEYERRRFELRSDPSSGTENNLHISIVQLYGDRDYFDDPRILKRFEDITEVVGKIVTLAPVPRDT